MDSLLAGMYHIHTGSKTGIQQRIYQKLINKHRIAPKTPRPGDIVPYKTNKIKVIKSCGISDMGRREVNRHGRERR
jgi:hypothetical protein